MPLIEIEGGQVESLLDGEMTGAPENIEMLRIRMSGPDFDDADKIINRNTREDRVVFDSYPIWLKHTLYILDENIAKLRKMEKLRLILKQAL